MAWNSSIRRSWAGGNRSTQRPQRALCDLCGLLFDCPPSRGRYGGSAQGAEKIGFPKFQSLPASAKPLRRGSLGPPRNVFEKLPRSEMLRLMHRVGIDLGGTKIEGILLDPGGKELIRRRVPTGQERGYAAILGTIGDLYRGIVAEAGQPPHSFGIGTPGAISPRTGLLKNSNTVCLNGQPLHRDLEQLLGRRVRIENDANCFALAEALQGAGRGARMVFGVIMGTGCGGGLVLDGQVWTGRQAIGGEWGHMVLQPGGPACYCGHRGCVETLISGGGLEQRWREAHGTARRLPEIMADFRRGDTLAGVFVAQFLANFGQALANLINALDPDVVVLGGGVSNHDELYTQGVAEVAKRVFSDGFDTPIVKHQLGDSAGVIGAALLGV